MTRRAVVRATAAAVATVGLLGAAGPTSAGTRSASDPPSVDIMTTEAVAYGEPYDSDMDGVPDFVFRPHFKAKVRALCPAGVAAGLGFNPVTGNQIPGINFTCTGQPQTLEINPASGHSPGVVHLTTQLLLPEGGDGPWRVVDEDAQDVRILDVRYNPPGAPGLRVGTVTAHTAALHWTAASGVGIVGYRFGWESLNGRPQPSWNSSVNSGPPNPFVMTNLCAGCTYRMWVEAVAAKDVGERAWVEVTTPVGSPPPAPHPPPSPPVPPTPPVAQKPSPPRSLQARPGNRKATLTWSAPARTGGARVDRYCVRQQARVVERCTTARSMVVRRLRNRVVHAFWVRAHTTAGWSDWSNKATVRPRR